MAGVREIRGRIRSVSNIQQITRAMKMVASARIKKVEARMKAARPYAYKMREVVRELMGGIDESLHPLMDVRPVGRIALVVVTADKGLCGAYNNSVLKLAENFVASQPAEREVTLLVVGAKAKRFFARRGRAMAAEHVGWAPDFELARTLAAEISTMFCQQQVDEVHCAYTQCVSTMMQRPVVERLLPLRTEEGSATHLPYLFEPSPARALALLLPRFLQVVVFQVLMEARTAELGARLRAMTNATENAGKLVNALTLEYFRARQAAITNEILEVATGAEALRD